MVKKGSTLHNILVVTVETLHISVASNIEDSQGS